MTATQRRRGMIALAVLGALSCVAGVAVAFVQSSQSSAGSLSIRVAPATRSVVSGGSAAYAIRITHGNGRTVTLSLLGARPRGMSVSFRPRATRTQRSTLRIVTRGAPSGRRRLRVLARSGRRRAIAVVTVEVGTRPRAVPLPTVVPRAPDPVTIAGNLSRPLGPGRVVPLDLALTNPGSVSLMVSGLEVSLESVTAPRASPTHPCALDDFSVAQFSGAHGFTLPAASTATLGEVGFPPGDWPQIAMVDKPRVNQNGCKGASLRFRYTGAATDGAP